MRKLVAAILCTLLMTGAAAGQKPTTKTPPNKKLPSVHNSVTVSAGLDPKVLEKERQVKDLLEKADATYARKEYEKALGEFLDAAKLAEEMGNDGLALLQHALEHAAHCYRELARYAEAEATYLRTIDVLTKWGGPFESSIGHRYLDLAEVQMRQKNLEQTERYLRKAVDTYELSIQHFNDSEFLVYNIRRSKVTGLFYLGLICRNQGKHEEALKAWEEGFALGEKSQAKPERLLQMAALAMDLLGQLGRNSERDAWMKRYERVQAQASKPTP